MIEQTDRGEKSGSRLLYLLLGLGAGSILTLLFTSQSGDETRDYVAGKARDAKDYTQQKLQNVQDRVGTLIEQGKEAVKEKNKQLNAAVDAGRETYSQEIAKGKAAGID